MIAGRMARISACLLVCFRSGLVPAYAEDVLACDVEELIESLSSEPVGHERIEKTLFGHSAEGARIAYFYATGGLKRIDAVFYGETGKADVLYAFTSPDTYAVRWVDYHYTSPIDSGRSKIASKVSIEFVICRGKLVQGLFNEEIRERYERLTGWLKDLLEHAPGRTKDDGKAGE